MGEPKRISCYIYNQRQHSEKRWPLVVHGESEKILPRFYFATFKRWTYRNVSLLSSFPSVGIFFIVIFALWKYSKYLSIEVTKPRAIKFLGACLNNASNVETFCAFDLEIC